eukprot:jgi/Hompol1/315/HPOL_002464-RA
MLQVYSVKDQSNTNTNAPSSSATGAALSSTVSAPNGTLDDAQVDGYDNDLALPSIQPLPEAIESTCPPKTARLELVAEFRLSGIIVSLGVVSMAAFGRPDYLLAAFRDAKMSLIEYSPISHKLVTVSMHLFEREEFRKICSADRGPPEIRVDPLGRCAAMRFYDDRLAILPFKQEDPTANPDPSDPTSKYPFLPSFVVPFTDFDPSVRNIVDFTFLFGYYEPVLAIMYEPVQTCTGRLDFLKDSISIIVVSLDITKRKYPILYRCSGLPYNCTSLIAAPLPVGGLVILSHNAIIHMDQVRLPGIACIVNAYFDREFNIKPPADGGYFTQDLPPPPPKKRSVYLSHNNATDYHELGISLDGSRAVFLNPDVLLLVLRDGEMLQVDLIGDESVGRSWKRRRGGVKQFQITRLGLRTTTPAHLVPIAHAADPILAKATTDSPLTGTFRGPGNSVLRYAYLFVTSRTTDAHLLQFVEVLQAPKVKHKHTLDRMDSNGVSTALHANGSADPDFVDGLDDDLYGETSASVSKRDPQQQLPSSSILKPSEQQNSIGANGSSSDHPVNETVAFDLPETIRYRLCDAVIVVSPFRDFAVGEPAIPSSYAFSQKQPSCELEVVAASGDGVHGSLAILNRNVRPQIISSFDMPDVEEMWSVRCSPVKRVDKADGANISNDAYHDYIFLSRKQGTSILHVGDEFTEVDEKAFYQAGPTIGIASILDDTEVVQVHPDSLFLFDHEGVKRQEITIGNDKCWAVSCSIADPYIVLQMSVGELRLFKIDPATRLLVSAGEFKARAVSACSIYCDPTGGKLMPTNADAAISHARMVPREYRTPQKKRSDEVDNATSLKRSKTSVPDQDSEIYHDQMDTATDEQRASDNGAQGEADDVEMDDIYGGAADVSNKSNAQVSGMVGADPKITDANVSQMSASDDAKAANLGPRFWCFVMTEEGHLIVLSLPDFVERAAFPGFRALPTLSADRPDWESLAAASTSKILGDDFDDILVVNMGVQKDDLTPYLIARTSRADLAIFKIFVCPSLQSTEGLDDALSIFTAPGAATKQPPSATPTSEHIDERLAIRLLRIPNDQVTRSLQFYTDTEGDKLNLVEEPQRQFTLFKKQHLRPFDAIGSPAGNMYSGVVVTGNRPCWIMFPLSSRCLDLISLDATGNRHKLPSKQVQGSNSLRVHPMAVDGPIRCFAPLHTREIPYGFMHINASGSLRMSMLPPQFNYDYHWPVCKIPLGRTVGKIAYHHSSHTYIIATSVPERFDIPNAQYASAVAAAVIDEGDPLPDSERRISGIRELAEITPGMYEATVDRFRIELVSPVTWETVDSFELTEAETVTSLLATNFASKETSTGKKLFVAVGTGYQRSEDLLNRGKLHIYNIIDVVPDPNNPERKHKFKHMSSVEDRSPFSAMCSIREYIVTAIGPKIIMYELEDGELNAVAFMDVNIYVTSLSAVKNLILMCDIHKSVWFIAFQDEPAKLQMIGKDVQPLMGFYAEMMIDDNQLALLVADGEKNLHVMAYSPYNVHSLGGQRLIRRGEMHLGQHITKMIRLHCKPLIKNNAIVTKYQYMNLAATVEGSLIVIQPVSEKIFKRLYGLYSRMVLALEPIAGLNPRGFRQIQQRIKVAALTPVMGPPGPRGILDGDLLYQYLSLSRTQQRSLAKAIGSRDDRLIDDMLEVNCASDFF